MHLIFRILIDHLQHNRGITRVKLTSAALCYLTSYLFLRHDIPIAALGGHGIICIRNTYNPCHFRYLLSPQPVRISCPIITLMMPPCRRFAKPDLVFLDIYMDGSDGIESARTLRRMGYTGGIIFTTSSTEHAMDSYEVNALYYLQKPYDHNHFMNAMKRCGHLFNMINRNFTYTIRKRQYSVPYTDIVYFETGRHTVVLHTISGTVSFSDNLTRIVELLRGTDDFLPIGRSYLVNLHYVTGQAENDLLMSDGSIVQIPLKKQRETLSAIEQWRKSISR